MEKKRKKVQRIKEFVRLVSLLPIDVIMKIAYKTCSSDYQYPRDIYTSSIYYNISNLVNTMESSRSGLEKAIRRMYAQGAFNHVETTNQIVQEYEYLLDKVSNSLDLDVVLSRGFLRLHNQVVNKLDEIKPDVDGELLHFDLNMYDPRYNFMKNGREWEVEVSDDDQRTLLVDESFINNCTEIPSDLDYEDLFHICINKENYDKLKTLPGFDKMVLEDMQDIHYPEN